ncbi:MAG: UDP-N-acetylmuramate dehydrogenase [Eubacteriaceae bacterium]|jgi:UDP-N-acetylmuramate dehydrogenase|nr:UDP-N-acetylmuramate dehydrogenase [Eubacteriaceae bacterium]
MHVKQKLQSILGDRYKENEAMSKHTSFRTGGIADIYLMPMSEQELISALEALKESGTSFYVLGSCSNVIISDEGIKGAVVSTLLLKGISRISGQCISALAGTSLNSLSLYAKQHSLTGLEFAYGIPGSVGGAVVMNAGAYDGEMSFVVSSVRYLDAQLRPALLEKESLGFGYRRSAFSNSDGIVLSASFELATGEMGSIGEKMDSFSAQRRDKQPLSYPSAGSVFKRPEGYYAGALIEAAGLKGYSIGGAKVSEKHAGFIVNYSNASSKDITDLIAHVQSVVHEKHGVWLETEVRIIGS